MKQVAFCLMGPTAIGKTDLACSLTDLLPLEIINVDSSLMYQEFNIGAAKPDEAVLKKYPHHLVNCCHLQSVYSVAEFVDDVKQISQQIWQRGKFPLLVGGTMMYFHALQHGLASLPQASPELRQSLMDEAQTKSWPVMHQKLQEVDPVAAAKIHPHDQQRILRGLEIYRLTGQAWSQLLKDDKRLNDTKWHNIALLPEPRSWLHQRIAKRLDGMAQQGFLDEVRGILAITDLNVEHPALRSVGYRQAISFLKGALKANEWQEKALFATRQLAKRQMTWLRGFEDKTVFLCPDAEIETKIVAWMKEILDNM